MTERICHPLTAIDLVCGTEQREAEAKAERKRHEDELKAALDAERKKKRRGNGRHRDSLYMSDNELADLVLGPGKAKQWASLVPTLERGEGLPKVDPLMGGRYVSAIKAWLDRRHGLRPDIVPASADGEEDWSK